MRDLADGESTEVQGSGRKPYVLKNVGGVYSCSCPAWRNQSLGIERRTCKHLRALRGDDAETARVGAPLAPSRKAVKATAPGLMLAQKWDPEQDDVDGWWMSEKLDGVRALWTGSEFLSRNGNRYLAPDWFTDALPGDEQLDGELWIGRGEFQKTVSVVRRHDAGEEWRAVRFFMFDAPKIDGDFEERQESFPRDRSRRPFTKGSRDLVKGVSELKKGLT